MTGSMRPSAAFSAPPSSSRRTPARTSKPAPASRSAVARPMPVDAPVMTTVPRGMRATLSAVVARQAVLEPGVVDEQLRQIQRGGDVEEHPRGEELCQLLAVEAAKLAHEVVELRVPAAREIAHVLVAA